MNPYGLRCVVAALMVFAYILQAEPVTPPATGAGLSAQVLTKFCPALLDKLDRGERPRVWVRTREGADLGSAKCRQLLARHPGLKRKYIVGFVGTLSVAELGLLQDHPDVIDVIEDGVLYAGRDESVPIINADDVHRMDVDGIAIDGSGKNVAILDSGIDPAHPELAPKIVAGPDFIDDDDDPTDTQGHGTKVAGIVSRAAPGARLVSVRVCDDAATCYWSDIAAGLFWCYRNRDSVGISVLNLSIQDYKAWSDSTCPSTLDPYFRLAYQAGILIAACAGNQGLTTGVGYPACSPYVISVGSSRKSDTAVYRNSNRGPNLDLLAPGEQIRSTSLGGTEVVGTGTSFAAPHVAAAIALVRQYAGLLHRPMSPTEIESLLEETGKMIEQWPRVDVLAAVQRLAQTTQARGRWAQGVPAAHAVRFGSSTASGSPTVQFVLSTRQDVVLTVSALSGRVVREMHEGSLPSGSCLLTWDAADQEGRPVAAGVYVLGLRIGPTQWRGTVNVLRR